MANDPNQCRAHVTGSSRARASSARDTESLLELCGEVYGAALEKRRSYYDKQGELRVVAEPDLTAAARAIELMGKLLGIVGDGRNMTLEQFRAELASRGLRLAPSLQSVPVPATTITSGMPRQR
jgi:hypothetical protein